MKNDQLKLVATLTEFKKIIECLELSYERKNSSLYFFYNDLKINFNRGYINVFEKIPFNIIDAVNRKYSSINPNVCCGILGDSEFFNFINNEYDPVNDKEKYYIEKQKMANRYNTLKYYDSVKIDNFDDLLAFMIEVKKYYENDKENNYDFYEIKNQVIYDILKDIDFSISFDKYKNTCRISKCKDDLDFLVLLGLFDKIVNPFIGNNLTIQNIHKYTDKLTIRSSLDVNGNAFVYLFKKDAGYTYFYRNSGSFGFAFYPDSRLFFEIASISHYYNNTNGCEYLEVGKYRLNITTGLIDEYDMKNGDFISHGNDKALFSKIYDMLQESIEEAEKVTVLNSSCKVRK